MSKSLAFTSPSRVHALLAPCVELLEPRHMLSAGVSTPHALRHASHHHAATHTGAHGRHYHLPAVFSAAQIVAVSRSNAGLASGDFNGDQKPDLVVTNAEDDSVSILLNDGHGAFAAGINAPVGASLMQAPFTVITGDFNHDGKTDVAIRHLQQGDVYVLLGNGDGTLRAAQHSTSPANSTVFLAVNDANRDGNLDIIDGSENPLLGNGDGTFHQTQTNVITDAVGDFNEDGKLDELNLTAPIGVETLLGQGDGTFVYTGTPSPYPAGVLLPNTGAAVAGQFNADTHLDVAFLSANGTYGTYLMPGLGNGMFGAGTKISDVTGQKIATGDINGDGKADILVLSLGENNTFIVHALLGNGSGVFSRGDDISVPLGGIIPDKIVVADFNADGKQDVVVPTIFSSQVRIFFGL